MSSYAVPAAVLVVVGFSEASLVLNGKPPTIKPVIGGFLLGIGLYAITALDDRLGSLFAGLVVLSALIAHGESVFTAVTGGKKT